MMGGSRITRNQKLNITKGGKSATRYGGGTQGQISSQIFNVIGAYVSVPLMDGAYYFGDEDCYLFSLEPSLKTFYSSGYSKSKNFVKFNSKAGTAGAGLGFGKNKNRCRFWIDQNFVKSSVCYDDDTYESGWLTEKGTAHLNIECLEVLGCGDDYTWQNYLRQQNEMQLLVAQTARERVSQHVTNNNPGINISKGGITGSHVPGQSQTPQLFANPAMNNPQAQPQQ
jgi:hypothetical protein